MSDTVTENFKQNFGPTALITGASSGIGAAFAELLAERGLNLIVSARSDRRLEALANRLSAEHGVNVEPVSSDLSVADAPGKLAAACADADIGLIVSNAGFGLKGAHQAQDEQECLEMLMVNCNAAMQLSRIFAPRLHKRGRGGLLFTSSVEGYFGFPFSAAYSATKGFMNNFGEALWGELNPHGIDVLALCPSSTDTEALDKQGIDKSQLDLMSPREVAMIGLDNLKNGPLMIAGEQNQAMIDATLAMPRHDALHMMAQAMQASFK